MEVQRLAIVSKLNPTIFTFCNTRNSRWNALTNSFYGYIVFSQEASRRIPRDGVTAVERRKRGPLDLCWWSDCHRSPGASDAAVKEFGNAGWSVIDRRPLLSGLRGRGFFEAILKRFTSGTICHGRGRTSAEAIRNASRWFIMERWDDIMETNDWGGV